MDVQIVPVGPEQCDDVAGLFGSARVTADCWCMWWRKPNKEWNAATAQDNRDDFETGVRSGAPVGLLAYAGDGTAVGWVATAPRPAYPRLLRSTALHLTDQSDPAVWSVPCFFIHRDHRRTGVGTALLAAAVGYAHGLGAGALEGYPAAEGDRRRGSGELSTGTVGMFLDNGFTEYARPAGARVVMRRDLPSPG